MDSDETPEVTLAEPAPDDTSATFEGDVVGKIEGLVWQDSTGVDIVCVLIDVDHVAVPVAHDEWRGGGLVELGYDEVQIRGAPLLDQLQHLESAEAIEQVADHYVLGLNGPPPGPDPQPLPPWWDPGNRQ
jgi:hypothetical protein